MAVSWCFACGNSVETYSCLPRRPCPAPRPCSASQRHLGPARCRKHILWFIYVFLCFKGHRCVMAEWILTSMSASVPADSGRSPHPSCPSDTPAFSAKRGVKYLRHSSWNNLKRVLSRTRTRWTSLFPPFRIEIPSLRVVVTIGPVSPAWDRRWCKNTGRLWTEPHSRKGWRDEAAAPLQALIICSTISAAPRLWSLDCW